MLKEMVEILINSRHRNIGDNYCVKELQKNWQKIKNKVYNLLTTTWQE